MPSLRYSRCVAAGMLLLTCFVCFGRFPYLSSLAQSNEDPAIHSLVQRFFELYQQKDIDKLISLWSEKSPSLAENKTSLAKEFTDYEKIVVKGFEIRQMKIDGDKASTRVAVDMVLTRAKMDKPTESLV